MNLTVKNSCREVDVLVVGGGPAGCTAAIAAARDGADVMILESSSALGGMATGGLVSKWAPFTDKEKVIYHSIALEVLQRYKERMQYPEEKWDWVTISPEDLKIVYDDMVAESGAKVLFQTLVCDTVVKDGKIDCVIAANKKGLTPFKAKVYIDCTGDADVAAFSGVKCELGDEYGNIQPASLCFAIANVHMDQCDIPLGSNPKDGLWAKIRDEGKFPLTCKHFIPAYLGDSVILANAGHIFDLDSTDPEAVSAAYAKGRKIAEEYLKALKYYLPEVFGDAIILATAPTMGVRESRRIDGEYRFTVEDYLARRSFEDEIGRNSYWLDCHAKKGAVNPHKIDAASTRYGKGESHGIPWRVMIPKGLDNLLVAGRSVSMERMALATIRVMPNCLAMGEAAGHGAAIAAAKGIGVREIDVKDVQAKIAK